MRIRILMSSDRESGAAKPVVQLAKGLQDLGHEIRFSCKPVRIWTSKPLLEFAEEYGIPADISLALSNRLNPLPYLKDISRLSAQLIEDKTDILITNYTPDFGVGVAARRLYHLRQPGRHLYHIRLRHRSEPERADFYHRRLYRNGTDHVVEISRRTALMNAVNLDLPRRHFSTIYGAINTETVAPDLPATDLKAEFKIPSNALLIGYPARLVPKRAPDEFLDLAKRLAKAEPCAHFVFIGRGPLEEQLKAEIAEAGLLGRVHIAGFREDFLNVVRAMDIVVFFREGTDGSCRALLESMALGRPVVVSDSGPLPEIVGYGAAGKVFPTGGKKRLAKQVIELLKDEQYRRELGEKARAEAEQRFTLEARIAAFEQLLTRIVS